MPSCEGGPNFFGSNLPATFHLYKQDIAGIVVAALGKTVGLVRSAVECPSLDLFGAMPIAKSRIVHESGWQLGQANEVWRTLITLLVTIGASAAERLCAAVGEKDDRFVSRLNPFEFCAANPTCGIGGIRTTHERTRENPGRFRFKGLRLEKNREIGREIVFLAQKVIRLPESRRAAMIMVPRDCINWNTNFPDRAETSGKSVFIGSRRIKKIASREKKIGLFLPRHISEFFQRI